MSGTLNVPAVCIIIRKDDEILFVKRSQTGYADGMYCLPAGHVEEKESFRMAAVREAFEEVGLVLKPNQLRHVHTQHTRKFDGPDRVHIFFEADTWAGTPQNMEPEKHCDINWLPADDLPYTEIVPLVADGLRRALAGEPYAEFDWDAAA